jgi:hypothetical protein
MKTFKFYLASLAVLFAALPIHAEVKEAPASIAAAMLVKVMSFEKTVGSKSEVSIYVIGSEDVASELKKGIGKANIKNVEVGPELPANVPSVLFVADASKLDAAMAFTHKNKILSVTGMPELVSKGITLGFGVGDDSKPKILLNLSASVEEGLDWNPAILKIAKTIQ